MTNKEIFLEHLAPTSHQPVLIEVESAMGTILKDVDGKQYYDLIAGVGVVSVGHNNSAIKEAVQKQMDKHSHVMVYGEYIQSSVIALAKNLSDLLPKKLGTSYLVNSGTEANEGAIKLAKRITGRHKIIAFERGYHGNTQGSMSISGNEAKKRGFRPLLPGITFLRFNNIEDLEQITNDIAGVILEPIQGDAGVIIPSGEFMKLLREKCSTTGAQLIFDEVQTGVGRTGKMFAFEHFDVIPDILTLAKGLGGGLPIGAFISSHKNMQLLAENPMLGHITTFGGNPVSCSAANAVLNIVKEKGFMNIVNEKGALFEHLLQHKEIKSIRRQGLMIAVELKNEDKVNKAIELALEQSVIIYWFLSTRNSFRISPPLTITMDEITTSCERLLKVLDNL
ncbi:MAG: aspartate aminotransferase family protein [Bacteroidetes bacterium]|nr:MAG: aspartate aminotransferase family protein [Bacteroidota bacterium]